MIILFALILCVLLVFCLFFGVLLARKDRNAKRHVDHGAKRVHHTRQRLRCFSLVLPAGDADVRDMVIELIGHAPEAAKILLDDLPS